jgi:hypothetical protein
MAESNRLTRELESREAESRPKKMWTPPQLLPEPEPEPGYTFRWIRISTLNNSDPTNISSKFREGWEPVKASSQPKLFSISNPNGRFPDGVEIGGLLLCKIPVEFMEQRSAYYQNQTDAQISSVDNNFMRDNDPRMPLFKERSSKVTFGRGTT